MSGQRSYQSQAEICLHLSGWCKSVLGCRPEVPADPSGTTILRYQDQACGQDSLQNTITRLGILGQGSVEQKRDSGWIVVEHPKELEIIKLSYRLEQDFEGAPGSRDVYRAVIDSSYFQLFGHHLLAFPIALEQEESLLLRVKMGICRVLPCNVRLAMWRWSRGVGA